MACHIFTKKISCHSNEHNMPQPYSILERDHDTRAHKNPEILLRHAYLMYFSNGATYLCFFRFCGGTLLKDIIKSKYRAQIYRNLKHRNTKRIYTEHIITIVLEQRCTC